VEGVVAWWLVRSSPDQIKNFGQSYHLGHLYPFDVQSVIISFRNFLPIFIMAKIHSRPQKDHGLWGREWLRLEEIEISRLAHVFPRFPSAARIYFEF